MIKVAKKRHPEGKFKVVDVLNDDLKQYANYFDFVFISGVFNTKLDNLPESVHEQWIERTLLKLISLCKEGISVNFLKEFVDWKEEGLYYCKIDDFIRFIVSKISKCFVIRHDYNLYEFTVYIYKNCEEFHVKSQDFEIVDLKSPGISLDLIEQYVKLRNKYINYLNTSKINLEGTISWLKETNVYIRGIVKKDELWGVLIIYIDNDYEVSMFAKERYKGIGSILLKIADEIAEKEKITKLWARTKSYNVIASKSFLINGWKKLDENSNFINFEKTFGEN